jgi:hypothetical protein
MLNMEVAGEAIAYKDLTDLRAKLIGLLQTKRQERQTHDQESARLRRDEKNILKFLGEKDDSSLESAPQEAGRGT